jgi:hypothetical protein
MRKLVSLTAISLFAIAFSTGAFALNPQPEPPGKSRVVHTNTTVNATGAMHGASGGGGAGVVKDADDTYCGTPVPGHPHVGTKCASVHTNAMGGTMAVHGNAAIGHTAARGAGGASADVDDNYCGTPVPGHPHVGANCPAAHVNAMGGAAGHNATH